MLTTEPFERLVQKMDSHSRLVRAWPLTGGVSAQIVAIEMAHADGQTQKMIVRLHGEIDRQQNPQVAADEFKLLQHLKSAGLAVPAPYYLDTSCEIFPIPYLVIEFVEGATDFAPKNLPGYLRQIATHLAQIHQLPAADFDFLPRQADNKFKQRPAKMDDSIGEGRIRDVLESVWPLTQHNPSVLLHGDFWPGNLLWRGSQVMAIIDWEDARTGDPLADLANSRLEILWAFGVEAMLEFTQIYQSLITLDYTNLPYWDLCAALRPAFKIPEWATDEAAEKRMRERHRWFVAQAIEK
ncbi:MAG: phosphotransferase family protein [Chloroflexi bacterium]|nr:phosphotransferase family protein [Chloroflexota bacterium]